VGVAVVPAGVPSFQPQFTTTAHTHNRQGKCDHAQLHMARPFYNSSTNRILTISAHFVLSAAPKEALGRPVCHCICAFSIAICIVSLAFHRSTSSAFLKIQ
jgi:hypothetical protein